MQEVALSREQRIEACLEQIVRQPDFPAFSAHIQELLCVLQDEEASLRRLTNLVLRDYSLTLRVLRTANSAWYNRSGRPVLSVTHAVVLIGCEGIRDLAGSLMLFEHFRRQPAPGLRELMLLSLLTANHARGVAAIAGYPRREDAYVCGMFRNLGEVLIACYFPREYAQILRRMKEGATERVACLEALHFRYEELALAMARHWNLPEKVQASIAAPAAGLRTESDLLQAAVGFSHALTTTVHRREPEGAASRLKLLLQDYLPALGLDQQDVTRVLESAILETKHTFAASNVPLDDLRLRRQAEAALAATAEEAPAGIEPELRAEELLERLVYDVQTVVESYPDFDLNRILLMALEAAYRGGPFDRVLVCLADAGRTEVQGRLGLGEHIESFRDGFRVPISLRGGPLGAALLRRQDLFLHRQLPIGRAETDTLKSLGAACCGLYPLTVAGVLGGCLYFDRLKEGPPPLPRTLELVARLRDLLSKAIFHRRGAEDAENAP